MTLQDKLAYGQYGSNLITDTAAHAVTAAAVAAMGIGAYVCLEAQDADCVIAEVDSDSMLLNSVKGADQGGGVWRHSSVTLNKGMRWFGRFYRVKRASGGNLMAYGILTQAL